MMAPAAMAGNPAANMFFAVACSRVRFVRLSEIDRDAVTEHYLRLDANDRRRRFCRAMCDEAVRKVAEETTDVMRVGLVIDGVLRGVGELFLPAALTGTVGEVSLSVETPYQRRGYGSQLLRKVLKLARNRFLTEAIFITLMENEPLVGLVRKAGGRIIMRDSELVLSMKLRMPSTFTMLGEMRMANEGGLFHMQEAVTGCAPTH